MHYARGGFGSGQLSGQSLAAEKPAIYAGFREFGGVAGPNACEYYMYIPPLVFELPLCLLS